MKFLLFSPILAARDDLGTIISVVFLVIAFLGWIMNLVNSNKPAAGTPARGPQPPRPREERLKNEIEVFLQEVAGKKKPENPPREMAAEERIRRLGGERQEPGPRPAVPQRMPTSRKPPAPPPKPKPRRVRPGEEVATRRVPDSGLGNELRKHLSDYMEPDRVEHEVEQRIGHNVERAVSEHLGVFGGEKVSSQAALLTGARSAQSTHPIVSLLRNQQGMRQAILLSEILSRPIGRRKS